MWESKKKTFNFIFLTGASPIRGTRAPQRCRHPSVTHLWSSLCRQRQQQHSSESRTISKKETRVPAAITPIRWLGSERRDARNSGCATLPHSKQISKMPNSTNLPFCHRWLRIPWHIANYNSFVTFKWYNACYLTVIFHSFGCLIIGVENGVAPTITNQFLTCNIYEEMRSQQAAI